MLHKSITTHGARNIKFPTAQQANQIYQYKNIKEKEDINKLKIKILV
jgi:hypothetical protein